MAQPLAEVGFMKLPQQCNINSEDQRFCGRTFFNLRSFQQNFSKHFDFSEESEMNTLLSMRLLLDN